MTSATSVRQYDVTALQFPIYFNREGDHDHDGMLFALTKNAPLLKYIRELSESGGSPGKYRAEAEKLAKELGVPLPSTTAEARQPHPLVRPLVLRACQGETVHLTLRNEVENRYVGPHLVGDGYDVRKHDGSQVGQNPHSLVEPGKTGNYEWNCLHEGVFPFHDGGNYSGGQDGTNVHGLFGALVVEPKGAIWRDPVTGLRSIKDGKAVELDGLYLDILPTGEGEEVGPSETTLEDHEWPAPCAYPNFNEEAHREFVIFFHDEPEFLPPHGLLEPNPCGDLGHSGTPHTGEHGGHGDELPIMPISYRAEPMINRERTLWRLLRQGHVLKRPVLNEEQHHSSWMFGDPVTPILKAYIGDPVRIRLVHAGVKETHVFHLHVYEWHAVPQDQTSPRIDAISISPQTAHTIEPIWGAGNRQQIAGDVIWHCHLYPHFHEGMWGIFRTFETRQEGKQGDALKSQHPIYAGRYVGEYPDGTPIERLLPLPGRPLPPPRPTDTRPGYPLYIPGEIRQKSPVPPWPQEKRPMPVDFDYRQLPTDLEKKAFNEEPVPGEMFTRNRFAKQQAAKCQKFQYNDSPELDLDVVVARKRIVYNRHGWHDPDGHLFYLAKEGDPDTRPGPKEPLFFRAQHGQILNLTLENRLPSVIEKTAFDLRFPPCDALPWEGECGMHVHMVKFDPVCGDGASVGWNYISGPSFGKKMVFRWWADQEFGSIFFHDHLFANYRQKHGLFGALIVEPIGAQFLDNFSDDPIRSGLQARIHVPKTAPDPKWFREFCLGIADFVPLFDRVGRPLNPPEVPGGHGDQGVMALNYRSEPLRERPGDPAHWFSSWYHPDPDTTRFATFANDPVWIRAIQGSHEEQHSLQVHGMRWLRFRANLDSTIRNQQTFGIAEAFTFLNAQNYGHGDYLYKLAAADDLWLGCWGIIRAYQKSEGEGVKGSPRFLGDGSTTSTETAASQVAESEPTAASTTAQPTPTSAATSAVRQFHVVAEQRRIVYRDPDLIDPFGLVYRLDSVVLPNGTIEKVSPSSPLEPLILRCREGETVKIVLKNDLPEDLEPEPFAPEVPVEERDPRTQQPDRPVSSHVSIHADLVEFNVLSDDGASVGFNPPQTIPPGQSRTYTWLASRLTGTVQQQLGPVLLQDMADVRNHRHHGLVGALIVEEEGATPRAVGDGKSTASSEDPERWYGSRVTVFLKDENSFEEVVLLLQDGLRFFLNGNIHFPLPDAPAGAGETELDAEDQGQKAFNYRSEPVGPHVDASGQPAGPGNWLANPKPATPVWLVPAKREVRLHLIGACDKPRNHSFTVHGVAWPEWQFLSGTGQPIVASEGALSCGTVRTFRFTPQHAGDHAYRSGVLKWAVSEGLWGIIRVV